ncbi:hypothetical protein NIES39_K01180 [Arthrospira platensis NIES-39]|nr:hypothetical protein NIES39_K01180 [Arthrospira platensis NIES-39]
MIPKTGGGYRRYPNSLTLLIHFWASYKELYELVRFDLGFPALIRGREWSHLHPLPFKTVLETFTSYGS